MKYRKRKLCILAGMLVLLLSGCGSKGKERKYIPLQKETYEKEVHSSVQIQKGTLEPVLTLRLKPDEFEIISYSIQKESLEVENLLVEKGQKVKAQETLVTFKNEGLKEKQKEYKDRIAEDQLLIDHYRKLQEIEGADSHQDEIKELQSDIQVMEAYRKETEAKLKDFSFIAEKSGVVINISQELLQGYGTRLKVLLQLASGSSNYTVTTEDDYAFHMDEIYEAKCGVASYEMKLIGIEEVDGGRKLTFEPQTDISGLSETDDLMMEIQKEPFQDAIYVAKEAIMTVDEKTYVYTLNEDGFQHAVPVKVQDIVDGYAIITGEVSEGEWVTVR